MVLKKHMGTMTMSYDDRYTTSIKRYCIKCGQLVAYTCMWIDDKGPYCLDCVKNLESDKCPCCNGTGYKNKK